MRIWDISPGRLCREHLLGEHRELHAIWSILTKNKKGYSRHPEVLRWKKSLKALYRRHDKLIDEMVRREYHHKSPLDKRLASGRACQKYYVNTRKEQLAILRNKRCACDTGKRTA